MRLSEPRLTPQGEADWDQEIRPYINPWNRPES